MITASGQKSSARRQLRVLTAIYAGIVLIAILSWFILDHAYVTASRKAQRESMQQIVEMAGVRADERLRGYGLIVKSLENILTYEKSAGTGRFCIACG